MIYEKPSKNITILSDIIVKCCDDCPFFKRTLRRCELTPGKSIDWSRDTSKPDFPKFCELKSYGVYRINKVKDEFGL